MPLHQGLESLLVALLRLANQLPLVNPNVTATTAATIAAVIAGSCCSGSALLAPGPLFPLCLCDVCHRFPVSFFFRAQVALEVSCYKRFTRSTISLCLLKVLSIWNNICMIIGDRLRALREEKKLSQGDIEKRTGLLRCYISRVEIGHTVPAIETLEKMARALECPLYQLFYDGEEPPVLPNLPKRKSSDDIAWGTSGKEARFLNKLRRLLGKADEEDRKLILYMAQKMANR